MIQVVVDRIKDKSLQGIQNDFTLEEQEKRIHLIDFVTNVSCLNLVLLDNIFSFCF